jgi:hypothetical protein
VVRLKWKLVSDHFEIVLILMQDRCTVCAECTIGLEIVWTHLMELPDVRLETVLELVQDRCMVCAKHTLGSGIVLDKRDGTPR